MCPRCEDQLIREGLLKHPSPDPRPAGGCGQEGQWNFNMALTTLRKDEQELQYFELFTALMRLAYSRKIIEINNWVDAVAGMGRERQKQLAGLFPGASEGKFHAPHETGRTEFHVGQGGWVFRRSSVPSFTKETSMTWWKHFTLAGNHIEANGNPRIILMDLSIKVIRLLMQKLQQPARQVLI